MQSIVIMHNIRFKNVCFVFKVLFLVFIKHLKINLVIKIIKLGHLKIRRKHVNKLGRYIHFNPIYKLPTLSSKVKTYFIW